MIYRVDFMTIDGKWLRFFCEKIKATKGSNIITMINVRSENQNHEHQVQACGFATYTIATIDKPAWWGAKSCAYCGN